MPNTELNRKISELREPTKSLDAPRRFTNSANWIADNAGPWDNGSTTIDWYWLPRDWTGSEDANAVLRDEMATHYVLDVIRCGPEETEITFYLVGPDGVDELAPKHGYRRNIVADRDYKTAIALAWVKWKEAK